MPSVMNSLIDPILLGLDTVRLRAQAKQPYGVQVLPNPGKTGIWQHLHRSASAGVPLE